jgi:galactitol-specific phosphotransferase system IIB component
MEEELGMNLFLGDEFYDEQDDSLLDPNDNNEVVVTDELDNEDIQNNDELVEDNNPEGVDEDDTDDGNDAHEDTDVSSSPPLYKSLASVLHEQGVLTSVDSSKLEEVKTVQDLADLITAEVKAKELSDLTDLQRKAVEAYRSGIDVETFQQHAKATESLDAITAEELNSNQELRQQLIYQDLINQGFSEQKAERLTQRSIESDDDVEDAREALDNIRKGVKERFEQEVKYNNEVKAKAAEDQAKLQKQLEKRILETEEPFKGIKVNEITRKQILSTMMDPISKNPTTGVEENALMKDQRESEDFTQRLYAAYTLTKGFKDFSYFGKTERSKATSELEKALKNNQHIIAGGSETHLDDTNASDYDIGDTLVFRQ